MDFKRELEFEVEMLDGQNGRICQREDNRLQEMRHKIDVLRLNQQKIKEEEKSLLASRGLTDE